MREKTEATEIEQQPKINRIGFDNLLEDIFGLNIRALKTIKVLLTSPFKYFEAARTPEWENKYTPSFRVWFGLIAMLVALNFIYNNDRSAMTGAYQSLMDQVVSDYSRGYNATQADHNHPPVEFRIDEKAAAKDLAKWIMVYFPFAYIPFMALAGLVVRFWGQSLTYVTRLRYLFAVIIPSTTFMFLTTFLVLVIGPELLSWLSVGLILFILIVDFATAYRGPFKGMDKAKRLWRSFALAAVLFIVYIFGSLTATIPAFIKTLNDNIERVEVSDEEPNTDSFDNDMQTPNPLSAQPLPGDSPEALRR